MNTLKITNIFAQRKTPLLKFQSKTEGQQISNNLKEVSLFIFRDILIFGFNKIWSYMMMCFLPHYLK